MASLLLTVALSLSPVHFDMEPPDDVFFQEALDGVRQPLPALAHAARPPVAAAGVMVDKHSCIHYKLQLHTDYLVALSPLEMDNLSMLTSMAREHTPAVHGCARMSLCACACACCAHGCGPSAKQKRTAIPSVACGEQNGPPQFACAAHDEHAHFEPTRVPRLACARECEACVHMVHEGTVGHDTASAESHGTCCHSEHHGTRAVGYTSAQSAQSAQPQLHLPHPLPTIPASADGPQLHWMMRMDVSLSHSRCSTCTASAEYNAHLRESVLDSLPLPCSQKRFQHFQQFRQYQQFQLTRFHPSLDLTAVQLRLNGTGTLLFYKPQSLTSPTETSEQSTVSIIILGVLLGVILSGYTRRVSRFNQIPTPLPHGGSVWVILTIFIMYLPGTSSVDPNQRTDWDKLPGMNEWDGIPYHDFLIIWFASLTTSLASIVQDGYTLLQTATETDGAGRTITAAAAAADEQKATEREKHMLRKQRLAACLLKYIKVESAVYRYLKHQVMNDGVKMFKYVKHVGVLKRTPKQWEELREEWDRATMARVGIQYADNAIFKWIEWIKLKSQIFHPPKTPEQLRVKFLEGFPESFDSVLISERLNGTLGGYLYPTTYPEWHPKYDSKTPTTAHEFAGKPDIDAAGLAFYPEWSRRVKVGLIKALPRGSVHMATDDQSRDSSNFGGEKPSSKPDDHAMQVQVAALQAAAEAAAHAAVQAVRDRNDADSDEDGYTELVAAAREITIDEICGICGGRGHFGKVAGKRCLTAVLGNKVPLEELLQTKYPRNLKFPNFNRGAKAKFSEQSNAASSPAQRPRSPRRPNPKGKFKSKHPTNRKAKAFETDNSIIEDSEPEDSDSSVEEAAKSVMHFAIDYESIITPPPSPPQAERSLASKSP